MQTEWKFGKHHAHFEQPDLLWLRFKGPTTFEEAKTTVDICQEVGAVQPKALVVALYFTRWRVEIDFVATEQDARALIAKKREKRGTRAA